MFFSSSTILTVRLLVQQLVDFGNTNVEFVFISGLFYNKSKTYW